MSINVLMCGGRRTGKTTIMAAMQREAQTAFAKGDLVLNVQNAGSLRIAENTIKNRFDNEDWETGVYYADDLASSASEEYLWDVSFRNASKSRIGLNFIDVPGEWFVKPEFKEKIRKYLKDSQILVIAVDSPHLLEEEGKYHNCFNRPEQLTDEIKQAFQGEPNKMRLVLFVPVKCELYRNRGQKGMQPDMEALLDSVKSGYANLLTYLTVNLKDSCTVAAAPCLTMGGMEFATFVPACDEDGNVLDEFIVNEETGLLDMTWISEYLYLLDENGDRYYRPENCIQPLLYILLYFVAVGRMRRSGFLGSLLGIFLNLPPQEVLDEVKSELLSKLKTESADGYAILNDPFKMLKSD